MGLILGTQINGLIGAILPGKEGGLIIGGFGDQEYFWTKKVSYSRFGGFKPKGPIF